MFVLSSDSVEAENAKQTVFTQAPTKWLPVANDSSVLSSGSLHSCNWIYSIYLAIKMLSASLKSASTFETIDPQDWPIEDQEKFVYQA